jgi:hypothetical protein
MNTRHVLKAEPGKLSIQGGTARFRTRYSFTVQYVAGAVLLARRVSVIEQTASPDALMRAEHRALIVACVMQASAALESELAEVLEYGPGHHLGSNGIDRDALLFIGPFAEIIGRCPGVLERWAMLLHLLKKPAFDKGQWPYQDAELLVGLRNELVHYRSQWDGVTKKKSVLVGLRAKRFARPTFLADNVNIFPQAVLSAECAEWACVTAAGFLDAAYLRLGVSGVLDAHRRPGAEFEKIIPPSGARFSPRNASSKSTRSRS